MSDPFNIHDDYTAVLKLLKAIADEIDEFYVKQSRDEDGDVAEIFGPFEGYGNYNGKFLFEQEHVYPNWPNLKCLRDDIRKFLED